MFVNKSFFAEQLRYDARGNISAQVWNVALRKGKHTDPFEIKVLTNGPTDTYVYDAHNRLTSQTGPYANLVNTYDNNGNIETLYRNFEGKAVDVLDHIYANNGNRLTRVNDTGSGDADNSDVTDNKRYETFKPINGGTTGVDYNYYADGSLRTDPVKNTGIIDYNYLNLPLSIPNQNITNTYDATGRKIQSNIAGVVYDYFAGVVFKKSKIEFIATPEGRVLPPNSVVQNYNRNIDPYNYGQDTTNLFWRYEYSLKDHLGNLRVACRCAENGASLNTPPYGGGAGGGVPTGAKPSDGYAPYVVQQVHYDAWGVKLPLFRSVDIDPYGGRPTDRYRYNGKEHIPQSGWYDYGARMYDPAIARWNAVDAMAEKMTEWSPYNYTFNNPIKFTDPDGNEPCCGIGGIWTSIKEEYNSLKDDIEKLSFSTFTKYEGEITSGARVITNQVVPTVPIAFKNVDEIDINANSVVIANLTLEHDDEGFHKDVTVSNKKESNMSTGISVSRELYAYGPAIVSGNVNYQQKRKTVNKRRVSETHEGGFGVSILGYGLHFKVESSDEQNVYRLSFANHGVSGGAIITGSLERSQGIKITQKK